MPDFKTNQNQQKQLQRAALAPKWQQWVHTLDPVQREVLEKNMLIDETGAPVIVQYKKSLPSRSQYSFIGSLGQPRYMDSKISRWAAQRLMRLDPTSNHVWTDWIFTQAGGGESSKGNVDEIVVKLKKGLALKHATKMAEKGKKMTAAELAADFEKRWAEQGDRIVALTRNANEDALEKIATASGVLVASYGFTYDFPGHENRYAKVEDAAKAYFSVYKKAVEMNEILADTDRQLEVGEEPAKPVPLTPDEMDDVDAMVVATRKVRMFFQARSARSDVRVASWKEKSVVYDDDIVTVIVPLTYSAAVKYGNDAWPWSNRETFQADVKSATSTNWTRMVRNGLVAYMMIHVPLRTYLHGAHTAKRRSRLNHVALIIQHNDINVYREDGSVCTVDNLLDEIHNSAPADHVLPDQEPQAQHGPIVPQSRYPINRETATRVAASVQAALKELDSFVQNFDRSTLVPDVAQIDITQSQGTAQAG